MDNKLENMPFKFGQSIYYKIPLDSSIALKEISSIET